MLYLMKDTISFSILQPRTQKLISLPKHYQDNIHTVLKNRQHSETATTCIHAGQETSYVCISA